MTQSAIRDPQSAIQLTQPEALRWGLLAQMAALKVTIEEMRANIATAAQQAGGESIEGRRALGLQVQAWSQERIASEAALLILEREFLDAEMAAYLAGEDAEFTAVHDIKIAPADGVQTIGMGGFGTLVIGA